MLAKVVHQTLTAGESFALGKIDGMATLAGLERDEIQPQLAGAQLGEDRKALIGDLTPLAMQEWGMDPNVSPSSAIVVLLVPWLFAATTSYYTLAKLAAEKAEREKKEKSGKSGNSPESPA